MTISTTKCDYDVLSDAMDTLDAGAAVFFRGSLGAPWDLAIPDSDEVLDLIGRPEGVDSVLMFHAVIDGHPTLRMGRDGEPLRLQPGDLVLLKLDGPHRMGEGSGGTCLTMASVVGGHDFRRPLVFDAGSGPGSARLICGGFFLKHTALHPLVAGLPPLTRVRPGGSFDTVALLLGMLARETESGGMGSQAVVGRLSDLLLVELLRAAVGEQKVQGWLAALRDPITRKALGVIHADPGADLDVPTIARHAGVSTSGLNQRFRKVLGQSPARYLATWRMHLATRLLDDPELGLAEVADAVGYGSVEAFSRAFKRTVGQSPGRWRRQASPEDRAAG